METRPVTFDCYYVQMRRDGGRSFNKVLQNIIDIPDDDRRNCTLPNGHPVRLRTATRNGTIWIGEVMQIKMTDIPLKASLKGNTAPLDLQDDEGIGMGVVFLYHSRTSVLVIQRNKFAVSASAFSRYVSEKGKCGLIHFEPVLNKHAMRRLAGLQSPKKLELRVAGLQRADVLRSRRRGVSDIVEIMELLRAPVIELTCSIGHSRSNRLSMKGAKQLITDLLGLPRREDVVQQLKIWGKDENQQDDIINLLSEGISIEKNVEIDGRRSMTYDARTSAILQVWEECEPEINEMFAEHSEEETDGTHR